MTPARLIPVMQDGDLTLFESTAILRYLVDTYSDGPLKSDDPRTDSWATWAKGISSGGFIMDIFWPYWRTAEEERDMDRVIAAVRTFEDNMGRAMAHRGPAPWVLGDAMTLADIWLGHVLYRYFTLDLPHDPPAGLRDYYAQMTARPAYQTHVMIDYSELKATRIGFQ